MASAGAVVAPIALATIGLAGLGLQPVLVSVLIQQGGFDASTAGYVASAEVFGIAIANVALTFTGARLSWRALCGTGLFLMLLGAALSLSVGSSAGPLMVARMVSGLGSGLLISRAYAAVGLTADPDRMLGYLLATSTAQVALASYFLPGLAASAVFIYFAGLALLGLPLLRWMPVRAEASIQARHSGSSRLERIAALAAAAFLFLGLGVLWAYLFQIGLSMGATTDQATIGLTLSQIAAFVGALAAAYGVRWIPVIALHVGSLLVTVLSVALFQFLSGGIAYALLAAGFNGASNTAMVLALGAVALVDIDGRWIAAAVTSQTLGFAFGPTLAAMVVTNDNYQVAQELSIGFLIFSVIGTLIAFWLERRRRTVALVASPP